MHCYKSLQSDVSHFINFGVNKKERGVGLLYFFLR